MFWYKLGTGLRCIGGLLLCALIYSFAWGIGDSPFPFEKDKEYYLYSPSSQAEITSSIDARDLFFLKGESAKVTTGVCRRGVEPLRRGNRFYGKI